jgi:hypothetical protein
MHAWAVAKQAGEGCTRTETWIWCRRGEFKAYDRGELEDMREAGARQQADEDVTAEQATGVAQVLLAMSTIFILGL